MDWIGLGETSFIVFIALAVAHALARRFGVPPFEGRYQGLDGLRGFLALFVFVDHSAIWHSYAKTGIWNNQMSELFTHLGQDAVWLFFMITGFLFFSKLLEARKQKFDWIRLYVSRVLRLYPLYLFTMAMFFLAAAILDSFQSNASYILILDEAFHWLVFSPPGYPLIGGISRTMALVGVVWTLIYEWMFYFSLPLQALCLGVVPPVFFIVLSFGALYFWHQVLGPVHINLLAFGAGMLSSFLVKSAVVTRLAGGRWATLVILACIALLAMKSAKDQSAMVLTPLFLIFALIVCGNDLFGILVAPAARILGAISYSIYLLHSLFLYAYFHFFLGQGRSFHLSIPVHWVCIDLATPVLVVLCFFTWRWIEKPPMRHTAALTDWVRANLTLRGIY